MQKESRSKSYSPPMVASAAPMRALEAAMGEQRVALS